ncbi:MAG: hypothetical protein QXG17_06490 [Sulfolobales archaeon]
MGAHFREHVVRDFLKVVVVCSEEPHAVGDIPGLPYCFSCDKSVTVGEGRVCYSGELALPSGKKVVIEGAEVLGVLRSISYLVREIECSVNPEELYEEISAFIREYCREHEHSTASTSE